MPTPCSAAWPRFARTAPEPRLGPDAKSQLTLRYAGGVPVEVTSLVLSTQHLDEDMTSADVRAMVEPYIREVLPEGWLTDATVWHVNPTGKFVIGGPDGDAGLTGRKIIVDTYGGGGTARGRRLLGQGSDEGGPLGGLCGALSREERGGGRGWRSGACSRPLRHRGGAAARSMSTRSGPARSTRPPSSAVAEVMDLSRRAASARSSASNRPIYQRTSAYGHFGRTPDNEGGSWERTDLTDALAKAVDAGAMDEDEGGAAGPRRNLYGRRRGKKLKPSQRRALDEVLPRVRMPVPPVLDAGPDAGLDAGFPGARPLWLEIGFGGGEHLIQQAKANPDAGIIGCEPFINGVAMALVRIEAEGSRQCAGPSGGRARPDRRVAPDGVLERVFLLYPDPWPKLRHHGRRFASEEYPRRWPGDGAGEPAWPRTFSTMPGHALEAVAATPGFEVVSVSEARRGPDADALRGEGARGGPRRSTRRSGACRAGAPGTGGHACPSGHPIEMTGTISIRLTTWSIP